MKIHLNKKRRVNFQFKPDIISRLPIQNTENILKRLPIKDAIKTSMLSKEWNNRWTSIPDLVFEEKFIGSEMVSFVDRVLLAHRGPITSFEINCKYGCGYQAMPRWLPILSQNWIKNLCLIFGTSKCCHIPVDLFSCHNLEHMEISNCVINAPQFFQGLKLLRTLNLDGCLLNEITMEKLVSGCPLLETLQLTEFINNGFLRICAPNLEKLKFEGWFTDISLEARNLVSATISLDNTLYFNGVREESMDRGSKLVRILGQLPNIEELSIGELFAKYLSSGSIPKKLPVTYPHLKNITADLHGTFKEGLGVALSIFRSSPNLKALDVYIPRQNIWEQQKLIAGVSFKNLTIVKILGFENTMSMLGFAKFLLSTAPKLKKLIIGKDELGNYRRKDQLKFMMELTRFSRLSNKAEILFVRSLDFL